MTDKQQTALINLYKALRKQRVHANCTVPLGQTHNRVVVEQTRWNRFIRGEKYEYTFDGRCSMCKLKQAYDKAVQLVGDKI